MFGCKDNNITGDSKTVTQSSENVTEQNKESMVTSDTDYMQTETEIPEDEMVNYDPITVEEFVNRLNLTPEQTHGLDLQEFVDLHNMKLKKATLSDFEKLKKEYLEESGAGHMYLINNPAKTDKMPELKNIRYIAVCFNIDALNQGILFDFESNKVYYNWSVNILRSLGCESAIEEDIDPVYIEKTIDIIKNYTKDWKYNYTPLIRLNPGTLSWSLAIEFENYDIYRFSGKDGHPDNFYKFREDIWRLVDESTMMTKEEWASVYGGPN